MNFDGIPGPTHNYSGLAQGNLAAERNAQQIANPREAALQGLAKMRALAARGIAQGVLPPQERPDVAALRALGFHGRDADVVARAGRQAPELLAACSSAAAMWAANAATVSPSADCADGRVHFTPANLVTHFHRALEAPTTTRVLRAIFADTARFCVHDPLPAAPQFGDEGAANHTRFGEAIGRPGAELFVFGRRGLSAGPMPARYPARQTREASAAIARRHGLEPARVVFAQQRPDAIDAGVFHNDVIAVGEGRFLLCHERAFVDQPALLRTLSRVVGPAFHSIVVRESELPLADAVATYLFNSQLIERADGRFLLVAPAECRAHRAASEVLDRLTTGDAPIAEILTFELRQSMRNGGGPACLRLRVPVTADERAAIRPNVILDEDLAAALENWIRRNYRDRLESADLRDPALLDESRRALDELTRLLELPSIYPFQLDTAAARTGESAL
ncbi:MAG: N-succinylarginine dihydrolase [Betaproteobacteria bacterium]|nr:N-succinylarginine dihydrolase [Betaproteobacteria bacterium]